MRLTHKNKLATSLALISILSFQPTISFAKEDPISSFFTKMFSSKSSKTDKLTKTQIYKSDINSLKLDTLIDFEFSIQDILKSYLDKKNINNVLNNISDKDDKSLNADSLDQFVNLLPKSKTDKINGKAIIRLAKKLGKDEKTIFEIKKNLILQVVASQGITLVYNEKSKKTDVAKVEKKDDIDTKDASSSNMPVIAGIAGLGAFGGGGGSSSGSYSTFLDENTSFNENASLTATWASRQEYKNVSQYLSSSTINPYTLVGIDHAYGRGLSGSGKTIAIVDNGYRTNQIELSGKTITNYNSASINQHGTHVASTAAGSYNSNSSTFVTDNSTDDWAVRNSGSYPLLNYGTMGVAYNANLHLTDYDIDVTTMGLATTSAKDAGAIVQNNSWGWGTCQSNNCPQTIDVWVNYQNNNGTTDAQTLDVLTDTEAGWTAYLSALDNFQNSGVVVVSAGNDSSSSEVNVQAGLPQIATELKEAWLVVGNIDTSGSTISSSSVTRQGNQCGVVAEYCIQADGTNITAADDDSNGDYTSLSGTSMAAPIVSGSIALLSEAFPNHTPEQLVDRLLASANNDFFTASGTTSFINGITHGYNAEFGHGILDLEKALSPVKTSSMLLSNKINLSTGNNFNHVGDAIRVPFNSSKIILPVAFGDAIQNSLKGTKSYFYDALNGGFVFDISSLIRSEVKNTQSHNFQNDFKITKSNNIKNNISFLNYTSDNGHISSSNFMTFIKDEKDNYNYFGKNLNVQNALSFSNRMENTFYEVNKNNPFNIPYLNASENGESFGSIQNINESSSYSLGFFEGNSGENKINTHGVVLEYSKQFQNSQLGLFSGMINEDNGFLESSIEGAFSLNSKTNTTFLGASSFGWLNSNWSYNAIFSNGFSNFENQDYGLIQNVEDIVSSSFAFDISKSIGLSQSDQFHIGISQPMRVESGNMSILIPELYKENGYLDYSSKNISISPSGRQIDLRFGYTGKISNIIDFKMQLALSDDYGHVKSSAIDYSSFFLAEINF